MPGHHHQGGRCLPTPPPSACLLPSRRPPRTRSLVPAPNRPTAQPEGRRSATRLQPRRPERVPGRHRLPGPEPERALCVEGVLRNEPVQAGRHRRLRPGVLLRHAGRPLPAGPARRGREHVHGAGLPRPPQLLLRPLRNFNQQAVGVLRQPVRRLRLRPHPQGPRVPALPVRGAPRRRLRRRRQRDERPEPVLRQPGNPVPARCGREPHLPGPRVLGRPPRLLPARCAGGGGPGRLLRQRLC
jgi:hypothetical protein